VYASIAKVLRVACLAGAVAGMGSASYANQLDCQQLSAEFDQQKGKLVEVELGVMLFKAADKNCPDVATKLLTAGGSPIMRRGSGDTALHHAASSGALEVALLLLDHGAGINEREIQGATPLFLAAENNRPEMVKALLDRHANSAIAGRSGVTALSAAAFNGNGKIVELLLASGADAKATDTTGKAAILYAAARGFTGIVDTLLKAGVDANAVYDHDLTALMWAAGYADDVPEDDGVKTATALLDHGAKIDAADDRGQTALATAAELGHQGVVGLLLKRGADRTIGNKVGKTPADLTTDNGIKELLAAK
jgi:uncharacterized protein